MPEQFDGVAYLRRLDRTTSDPQYRQMVNDRDSVLQRYGQVFHPDNLHRLTAYEFKEFLLYENNRHWWGIHRQQAQLIADMNRLRAGLGVLVDESERIGRRLDYLEPRSGKKPIPGLGKAVMTPILHVVYPDRYGVWNSISESAMTRLGLWPQFEWGSGFGSKYVTMNRQLVRVAGEVDVDLWTLDTLWWLTEREHEPTRHQFDGGVSGGASSATSGRRSKAVDTFLCSNCFQTKAANLRTSPEKDICLDCTR